MAKKEKQEARMWYVDPEEDDCRFDTIEELLEMASEDWNDGTYEMDVYKHIKTIKVIVDRKNIARIEESKK